MVNSLRLEEIKPEAVKKDRAKAFCKIAKQKIVTTINQLNCPKRRIVNGCTRETLGILLLFKAGLLVVNHLRGVFKIPATS